MTANAFTEDMEKSKEAGMDEHLSKPVDIAVLERAVGSTLLPPPKKKMRDRPPRFTRGALERIQEKGQNCMTAVLSFLRIPVKNRSPPAPGRGVQHFGGRVEQGIADGGGHVAAALAAHGHDGGYAKGFAGGK